MSEISSKDILISVNLGTTETPDWYKIACSTSDGFQGSTDVVTINSKCSAGFTDSAPGNKSWSFSNEAYANTTLDADQISYDDVFDLWVADTVTEFKIAHVTDESIYYRMGQGFISDLGETAADGDYLTFSITITGKGTVSNTPTT